MHSALVALALAFPFAAHAGESAVLLVSDPAERPYVFAQVGCTSGESDLRVRLEDRDGNLSLDFRNLVPRLRALAPGESVELPFTRDAELSVRFIDRQADAWRFAARGYRSSCRLRFEKRAGELTIQGECRKLRPATEDGFTLGFEIPPQSPIRCSI